MKILSTLIKYSGTVFLCILFISTARCQDEDEEDEDIYDEEIGDDSSTTKRPTTTGLPTLSPSVIAAGAHNDSLTNENSTIRSGAQATTRSSVPTPASAPAPTRATVRTTTLSEYEDDEVTTEEEGYGYVFRPLNNLIDNIVAGNVTGIVDNALSIRTPPEIRAFVNNVMSNVFGGGIGTALKQFMPHLFSTQAPPVASSNTRDPIPPSPPIQQTVVIQQPIPHTAPEPIPIITARNSSDEVKSAKTKTQPVQLSFAHPGAPASRLKCEVIQ